MKKKQIIILAIATIILTLLIIYILYILNYIPHKKYSNEDFNIKTYISSSDKDKDGIDDQTDILNSVKEYIKTKPKYKSKYYANGYPNDEYGVCTDVVAFGLKGAGYDLMQLVNEDIINNRDKYNIETIDINIDFRRVRNLKTYFENNAIPLTTDITKIDNFGISLSGRHIGNQYLVIKDDETVRLDKYKHINQKLNETSIVIELGGLYDENTLLPTTVSTIWYDDESSKRVYNNLKSIMKRYAVSIVNGYTILKNAYDKKEQLRFVTISVQSPKEYDLKL